ncbi:MAG: septum formation initiator family protein [Pelagibacteraceae bacterium]
MELIKIFKRKKILFLNIFLTLYVGINLIGGERGLFSYFEKKNIESKLLVRVVDLENKLKKVENKNKLLSEDIDLDYVETLYREKLKFGKKNEILIKLN